MIPTAAHLLTRSARPPAQPPGLPLAGNLALAPGRVHESCGPARGVLALLAAREAQGALIWIAPEWQTETLSGDGLQPFLEPRRLLLVRPNRREDLLWCMEEVLRSGSAAVVVAELPEPPGLTPVRRLHLAAEAGARVRSPAPLGLILTPEGAAPGVESRWSLSPRHSGQAEAWHLARLRARATPPAAWHLANRPGEFDLSPVRGAEAIPLPAEH